MIRGPSRSRTRYCVYVPLSCPSCGGTRRRCGLERMLLLMRQVRNRSSYGPEDSGTRGGSADVCARWGSTPTTHGFRGRCSTLSYLRVRAALLSTLEPVSGVEPEACTNSAVPSLFRGGECKVRVLCFPWKGNEEPILCKPARLTTSERTGLGLRCARVSDECLIH